MLQDATIVEGKHVESAMKLINCYQQQIDILRSDEDFKEVENVLEELVEKDVILFKGSEIKGIMFLVRRRNPYAGGKCAALEHERAFKRLADKGTGTTVSLVGRKQMILFVFQETISRNSKRPKKFGSVA